MILIAAPALIEPYVTVGGAVLIAIVTAGFGYLGVRLEVQNRRTNKVANQAADKAVEATTTAVQANAVDHRNTEILLEALARDIGGIRADFRTVHNRLDVMRSDVARVDDRLARHLDESSNR